VRKRRSHEAHRPAEPHSSLDGPWSAPNIQVPAIDRHCILSRNLPSSLCLVQHCSYDYIRTIAVDTLKVYVSAC
jgi:hypothetical protein